MKKISLKLVLAMISFSFIQTANANVQSDKIDTTEMANVMYHCASELKTLKEAILGRGVGDETVFVDAVTANSRKTGSKSYSKVYNVRLVSTLKDEVYFLKIEYKYKEATQAKPATGKYICSATY